MIHIANDAVAISDCYAHAPHWRACLLGPVPFGRPPGERVVLTLSAILTDTQDEAEEVAYAWARQTCEAYGHEYDPDEWEIHHIRPVNCN